MTTETKVEAVAVVTADGYISWLGDWLTSENWMKFSTGDKLYPQSALDALRGEVERLRVEIAGSQERAMIVLRAKDDWMERARAAERRVAELEAAAFAARGRLKYLNSLTGEKIEPVAVVMADGNICWLKDWLMSDEWARSNQGDKLYHATTVSALEAMVTELIDSVERAYAVLGVDDVSRRKSVQRDLRALLTRAKA